MDTIITFFSSLEKHPLLRFSFLIGGMLIFWIIEGAIPFLPMRYKKNKTNHAFVNMGFTVIHLIIHTFLAYIIILLADWCKANNFGIVHWINASTITTIVISILTLDFFGGWLVHFTQHKISFLWHFHVIHHADNNVDVTSGLRHHPGESILRGLFFFMGIMVSGAPMYAVMMFQTILIIAVAFTHANINLPKKVDSFLSYFLVSPAMHKVHHHYKQPFTDSNYGAIFSIWDRTLGTFMKLDKKDIIYGLDTYYPNEQDENMKDLLVYPFTKNK